MHFCTLPWPRGSPVHCWVTRAGQQAEGQGLALQAAVLGVIGNGKAKVLHAGRAGTDRVRVSPQVWAQVRAKEEWA